MLSTVVLPAPFGPMMLVTMPLCMRADTSDTARTPPNEMPSPSTSSAWRGATGRHEQLRRDRRRGRIGSRSSAERGDRTRRDAAGREQQHREQQDAEQQHAILGEAGQQLRQCRRR